MHTTLVQPNPVAPGAALVGRDFDRLEARAHQSPEAGGTPVAEDGVVATGKHRGEPDASSIHPAVA